MTHKNRPIILTGHGSSKAMQTIAPIISSGPDSKLKTPLITPIFVPSNLSESEQDRIYRSVVTSIVGRISTNIIASNIAKAVIEKTSFTYVVFKGKRNPISFLSTILLFGGMAERSIRTTDKLRNEAPEVYSLLRPRDYDLLYFLFADAVQPFVDAIHAGNTEGNPVFD